MTVTASTMTHGYSLVEDWLSLDHWATYGVSSREYGIQHGLPVGLGNALRVGPDGPLRIARDTDITPGVPHVLTYQAWCATAGRSPCTLQIRGSEGNEFTLIAAANLAGVFRQGWNSVMVNFTPPAEWDRVRLALFTTSADGGLLGPIRAIPAEQGE